MSRRLDAAYVARLVVEHRLDEDEARELVEAGAAAEDGPAARAVTAELVATHDATDAP